MLTLKLCLEQSRAHDVLQVKHSCRKVQQRKRTSLRKLASGTKILSSRISRNPIKSFSTFICDPSPFFLSLCLSLSLLSYIDSAP